MGAARGAARAAPPWRASCATRAHEDYDALWRWSVDDLEGFWAAIWELLRRRGRATSACSPTPRCRARSGSRARRSTTPSTCSAASPTTASRSCHASELRPLDALDVGRPADAHGRGSAPASPRAASAGATASPATCPNVPDTIAAFLATASLGAIWSSAAPEFGARSVIDRFAQIEPKVLLADRRLPLRRPGLRPRARSSTASHAEVGGELVRLGHLDGSGWEDGFLRRRRRSSSSACRSTHPLWVLYSSGTTGLPKAIVQGQGGILLEHLKMLGLHVDAREGDRVFWFTTTGWMMWNFLVSVLLTDAAIVLYDGNPATPDLNGCGTSPRRREMTCFGTSAGYIASCMKAGDRARRGARPLPPARRRLDRLAARAGGLRVGLRARRRATRGCSPPAAGPTSAPRSSAAARSCRCTSASCRRARSAPTCTPSTRTGNEVIDEVGELVLTQPMPSMPLRFWGDEDGSRYREAYFDTYPGVWRHGDWIRITERGTAVIYGRSDSTINRGGVRMGTSEIYRAVLAVPEVVDALVVDVPREGEENWMPLFVVLREGARARRRPRRRDPPARARGLLAAPRPERGAARSPRCRARSRARCSRCRSSAS